MTIQVKATNLLLYYSVRFGQLTNSLKHYRWVPETYTILTLLC